MIVNIKLSNPLSCLDCPLLGGEGILYWCNLDIENEDLKIPVGLNRPQWCIEQNGK